MKLLLPDRKVTFPFRPTEQMLDGIKTVEPDLEPENFVYPDDFKLVSSEYGDKGRKIVIVSDRVSKQDVDRGELFSGYEADNYDKVLSWCLRNKRSDVDVSKVILFNWPFAWLSDAKKAYAAYEIFYQRFIRFIGKVRPHSVVICGPDVFEFILLKNLPSLPKQRWRHQMNRVIPITIGDHSFTITGTIDMLRPLSWDNKNVKDFPNLIGYLARGILAGIDGVNRYTVKIPKDKKFIYVDTIPKVKALFRRLRKAEVVSIDTEGASLNRVDNQLFSVQFAFSEKLAYFLPIEHPQSPFKPKQIAKIKIKLRNYFENAPKHSKYHIYQNSKYDLTMFHSQLGVRYYAHRTYDLQAGEFTLDENRKLLAKAYSVKPYSLDFISEQYGCDIYLKIPFSKGNRADIGRVGLTPDVISYGCYDVIVPWMIVQCQIKEAKRRKHDKFLTYITEQLSDTSLSFAQMEYVGIKMDRRHLFNLKSKEGPLHKMIVEQEAGFKQSKAVQKVNNYLKIKRGVPQGADLFGGSIWLFDVNKDLHQQLLFFKALKLPAINEKKNGDGKIDKVFQEEYKKIPEVAQFNRYKKLLTIRNNFVNALYSRLEKDKDARLDSRIRATFDYLDVTTSRTSARNPNMMNVPARGDLSKLIKRLFVADDGCMIIKNDYSAHEVRDWANEAHDKNLSASFYVGLKFRQELRLLAYTYPEQAESWISIKAKKGWYGVQKEIKDKIVGADVGFNKFNRIIEAIKDPITKKIAQAELELDMKGDVHKLNCQIFYKVPVLEVSEEQRYDIKAVVFGTIYGKTPQGLAVSLKKTEEYAQELQDTLFDKFPQGARWLKQTHKLGQEKLYVESPLGFRRHLWGYLHTRQGVINAMNRRGPNSIIQGVASNIGIASIRIMQGLIWNLFTKKNLPFFWRSAINYIHDSVESETKTHLIPIYLYMIEHASTTLIHEKFKRVYGYNLDIGLELEFQLGASLDRVNKWSFMPSELFDSIKTEMEWQKQTLGYKYAKDTLDKVVHNWSIVADLRRRELKEAVKSKEPSTLMLLTEKNSHSLGFKLL